ncbi:MAG: hypothetical protein V4864_12165 [Pseudomonadota bacterium]
MPAMLGIASAVVLSAAVTMAITGAAAAPVHKAAGQAAVAPPHAAKARKRLRCGECGVIQAIRRIDAADGQPVTYEFSVRLHDGSVRIVRSATPGNWRAGDRIMLKGGRSADASPV